MKITYLGTTVLLFDDGTDQILFDCNVSRPSIIECLTGRIMTKKSVADRVISKFEIDRLRGIFVSHSHHDHVLDAPYFALKCGADVYGSLSTLNVARGGNVPEERLFSYGDSMEYSIGGFRIDIIPSRHSPAHWYNDNLGKTIDAPLRQPANRHQFNEGGSFDFLVSHGRRKYLIRPSYGFLEGQLDDIHADVLFIGIGGMSKDSAEGHAKFFSETLEKVNPELVIPIHWDNFFAPLFGDVICFSRRLDDTDKAMRVLADYCAAKKIPCTVQLPLTSMIIG